MTNASNSDKAGDASNTSQPAYKFVTRASLLVDAVLVAVFFLFMFSIIRTHVQSENPLFITIWGGGAAACMSGVFWIALQMFRLVFRAQREARAAKK